MALEITYLGHSGFVLGDGTHKVVMDPFLTGNPLATIEPGDVEANTVLLTHGHEDHVGDAWAIAKRNGATVIACHEITLVAGEEGVDAVGANPGGKVETDWGWAAFTQARLGPPKMKLLPVLLDALEHPDGSRRWSAAKIVVELGRLEGEVLPVLLHFAEGRERPAANP